jgi:hypothetical protein
VARKVRLRLTGDGWHAYGGAAIPENREIVVTEAEAAAFLKDRRSRRSVEVVEVFDDDVAEPRAEA